MNRLTPVFLVALRLAIGWHLLFAGIEKVRKDYWSSEDYLRNASGPLGPSFRSMADDRVVKQATLLEIPTDVDRTKGPLRDYFPPALNEEWQAHFDRFVKHYRLDDEARKRAQDKFDELKEQTARWLLVEKKMVRKTGPNTTTFERQMTVPERLREYNDKLAELQRVRREEESPAAGTMYEELPERRAHALWAEANRIRAELRSDLNAQTAKMKTGLREVLSREQLEQYGDLNDPRSRWKHWQRIGDWTRLDWSDALVVVGLLVSGGLLLAGLFTRTACVLGALLLLMFYLPAMPLLGIPESLRSEGYPFINKNIVEMLALLMLATTQSGRWLGLDGLVQYLRPGRRRRQPSVDGRIPRAVPAQPAVVRAEPVSLATPIRRDPSHGH